jgi:hypothetical protein
MTWYAGREAITIFGVERWDLFRTNEKSYKLLATPGVHKFFWKSRRNFKILGVRMLTATKFRFEDRDAVKM